MTDKPTDVLTADETLTLKRFRKKYPEHLWIHGLVYRLVSRLQTPCVWTEDANGVWTSVCGEVFTFIAMGPEENDVNFCTYCGHPVEVKHYEEEEDDEREEP